MNEREALGIYLQLKLSDNGFSCRVCRAKSTVEMDLGKGYTSFCMDHAIQKLKELEEL